MLQIVFRQGPIDRAAEVFMESLLRGQQLRQAREELEIRKEETKRRQQEFEQQQARRQAMITEFLQTQAAQQTLQPQVPQIANANVTGLQPELMQGAQAGARSVLENPEAGPTLRRQAGQFAGITPEQTERVIGETDLGEDISSLQADLQGMGLEQTASILPTFARLSESLGVDTAAQLLRDPLQSAIEEDDALSELSQLQRRAERTLIRQREAQTELAQARLAALDEAEGDTGALVNWLAESTFSDDEQPQQRAQQFVEAIGTDRARALMQVSAEQDLNEPQRFAEFASGLILQEQPDGSFTVNPDGFAQASQIWNMAKRGPLTPQEALRAQAGILVRTMLADDDEITEEEQETAAGILERQFPGVRRPLILALLNRAINSEGKNLNLTSDERSEVNAAAASAAGSGTPFGGFINALTTLIGASQ